MKRKFDESRLIFLPILTMLILLISIVPTVLTMKNYIDDKREASMELNEEIESKLKEYKSSENYVIINPSLELDKVILEDKANGNLSNVRILDELYNGFKGENKYLYVMSKLNNDYQIVEIYSDIYEDSNGDFLSRNNTFLALNEAYKYENGKLIEFHSDMFNDKMLAEGIPSNPFQFTWLVSTLAIFILLAFLTIKFLYPKEI